MKDTGESMTLTDTAINVYGANSVEPRPTNLLYTHVAHFNNFRMAEDFTDYLRVLQIRFASVELDALCPELNIYWDQYSDASDARMVSVGDQSRAEYLQSGRQVPPIGRGNGFPRRTLVESVLELTPALTLSKSRE
jgi:hypothetical protein